MPRTNLLLLLLTRHLVFPFQPLPLRRTRRGSITFEQYAFLYLLPQLHCTYTLSRFLDYPR